MFFIWAERSPHSCTLFTRTLYTPIVWSPSPTPYNAKNFTAAAGHHASIFLPYRTVVSLPPFLLAFSMKRPLSYISNSIRFSPSKKKPVCFYPPSSSVSPVGSVGRTVLPAVYQTLTHTSYSSSYSSLSFERYAKGDLVLPVVTLGHQAPLG